MTPRLSVIVPTVHPWPRLRGPLAGLRDQALATNTEVIVADGHGAGLPPDLEPPFVGLRLPGADVFALRSAGVLAARGDAVALIEDHISVPEDWCEAVQRAFTEHPRAQGVIGTADNGAPRLLDRASFLVTWAPFLAPLEAAPTDRCPPPGVIAYRRSAVLADDLRPGRLEYDLPARLITEGAIAADDRIRMVHVQYLGWRAFPLQFHAGRGYTGFEAAGSPWRERLRWLAKATTVSWQLWRQTTTALGRRPGPPESLACRVAVAAMIACNGLGQVVGAVLGGPGTSPSHLE